MRTHNILSVAVLALTSIVTSVSANTWYAVFHNESGYTFLDTDKGELMVSAANNVQNVEDNSDKGQRWTFFNTKLFNQANGGSKYVGYDDDSRTFAAKYGDGDGNNLVKVESNNTHASFCRRTECVGPSGTIAEKYFWRIQTIAEA